MLQRLISFKQKILGAWENKARILIKQDKKVLMCTGLDLFLYLILTAEDMCSYRGNNLLNG